MTNSINFIKTTADNLVQEDTDLIRIFNNETDAVVWYQVNNFVSPNVKLAAYTYRIKGKYQSKDYYAVVKLNKLGDRGVEINNLPIPVQK